MHSSRLIICDGMPRSASTWSYNVCRLIAAEIAGSAEIHVGFTNTPGSAYLEHRSEARAFVLKSHALDGSAEMLLREGMGRAIYTYRNPHDAVASHMAMFGSNFADALGSIQKSLRVFRFHLDTGTAFLLPYDYVTWRTSSAVSDVAGYLGAELASDVLDRIADTCSFANVKRTSAHIANCPDANVIEGERIYSKLTLLHQDHIRDGSSGYGKSRLSEEQRAAVYGACEAELGSSYLNYAFPRVLLDDVPATVAGSASS